MTKRTLSAKKDLFVTSIITNYCGNHSSRIAVLPLLRKCKIVALFQKIFNWIKSSCWDYDKAVCGVLLKFALRITQIKFNMQKLANVLSHDNTGCRDLKSHQKHSQIHVYYLVLQGITTQNLINYEWTATSF